MTWSSGWRCAGAIVMPVATADGEKPVDFAEFRTTMKRTLREPHYQMRRVAESIRRLGGAEDAAHRIEQAAALFRSAALRELIAVRWSAGRILTGKEWTCAFRFSGWVPVRQVEPNDEVHLESKERGMGKFGNWFAGVAATVISGVAIWYFTKTPAPTPPPQPPPAPIVTTFEGMVYSGDTPVPNAMVAVELTGDAASNGAVHNVTDAHGSYLINLTGVPQAAGATLTVAAAGYREGGPESLSIPLQQDNRLDIALTPTKAPFIAELPAHPPVKRLPAYVRKNAAQATQFRIQVRPKQP